MVRSYKNSPSPELNNLVYRTRWVRSPQTFRDFPSTHKIFFPFSFTSDPNFSALPTYPVVLALKGADTDVNLFSQRIKGRPIPGMPPMDPNRVVRSSLFPSFHKNNIDE